MMRIWISVFLIAIGQWAWADAPMLIDVRTPFEYEDGHAEGASNIPYESVAHQLQKQGVTKDTAVYLYCRSGRRATYAKGFLEQAGYTNVINLGTLSDANTYLENHTLGE